MLQKKYQNKKELVKGYLLELLGEKSFEAGKQIPTQKEIANELQVNSLTVNKAIGDFVEEGILYRRRGSGTFIAEKKRDKSSSLKICLLLPEVNLTDPVCHPEVWHLNQGLISAFVKVSSKYGVFSTLVIEPTKSFENVKKELEPFDIIFLTGDPRYKKLFNILVSKRTIQVITLGNENFSNLLTLNVRSATFGNVKISIEYLFERGYKKIAFIGSDDKFTDKFYGYQAGVNTVGLTYDERLVVLGINSQQDGERGVIELLSRNAKFDAIFVDTDQKAVGVLNYLLKKGFNIPKDIGIMGYDGVDQYTYGFPFLTTIKTPYEEIVDLAINNFLNDSDFSKIKRVDILANIIKGKTTL